MRVRIGATLLATALAAGCPGNADPPAKVADPRPVQGATPDTSEPPPRIECPPADAAPDPRTARVALAWCREAHRSHAVGAQLAVLRGDELVVSWAIGRRCAHEATPMQTQTRQRIGSLTKFLTAATLLALATEGRLELDTPIRTLAPRLVPNPAGAITLRHLLDQTSGLVDVPPAPHLVGLDDAALAAALVGEGPRTPPGVEFHYANGNYVLAGLVAQAVAGPIVPRIAATALGGTAASFEPGPDDACGHLGDVDGPRPYRPADDLALFAFGATYTAPAGGVLASAEDLARLVARHAPTLTSNPPVATGRGDQVYTMGWYGHPESDGTRRWSHPGHTGDFSADAYWIEHSNVTVVVITNGSQPLRAAGLLAAQVFGGARGRGRR